MQNGFWEKLKRPVMVVAPMSGVTDEAFRLMFLKYGRPDVFWTEFVSAEGLLSEKGREYCLGVLKFSPKERPIVAQIFGGDPVYFEKAAKIIVKLGFDGIDINMGCPDKDIEKRGGGAALIKNFALAKEIIRATKKGAGKIPVSVKTRIGYDKNQINEWIPALLEENIAALTVHFRTRKEIYIPPAHWELAEEIVKLRDRYAPARAGRPKTLIIGNGDVKTLAEARQLVEKTGLDGIMAGRGVLGNPWFFLASPTSSGQRPTSSSRRPKLISEGGYGWQPSLKERLNAIVEHAEIFESFHKRKQFDSMKKHFHAYTKGFIGAKNLREKLMKVKNSVETKKTIEDFLKSVV